LSLFTADIQLISTVSTVPANIHLRAVVKFDVLSAAAVEEVVLVQFHQVLRTIVAAVRDTNLDGKQLYQRRLLVLLRVTSGQTLFGATYHTAGDVEKRNQPVNDQPDHALQYRDPLCSDTDDSREEGDPANECSVAKRDR
jgi:hypothetical protein